MVDKGSREGAELHVPFDGTRGLLENQPNLYGNAPDGQVVGSEIVLPLGRPEGAESRIARWLPLVQQHLTAVASDLEIWRTQLRDALRAWVTRRRGEAEQHQAGVQALGIPVYRRGDAPSVFREPAIVRREPPTASSPSAARPGEPEPTLSDAYYEHILFVIRAAGNAMERAPDTYAGWDEEARRQVLILLLNTHYAGKESRNNYCGEHGRG